VNGRSTAYGYTIPVGLIEYHLIGPEVLAEVVVPDDIDVAGFAVHPMLLDAAVQTSAVLTDPGETQVPTAWTEVAVHSAGVGGTVRIRATATDDGVTVVLADASGAPVATLGSVVSQPVSARDVSGDGSLLEVTWAPLPDVTTGSEVADIMAVSETAAVPPWVALPVVTGSNAEPEPDRARAVVAEVLRVVQDFLAHPRWEDSRLLVITSRAVDTGPSDSAHVDPVAAAVWGLVRSAQTENPDRIVLADVDQPGRVPAPETITAAGEWQVAVRAGQVLAPRLTLVDDRGDRPGALDPAGTVVLTGGTGALGALTARHLVAAHGIRSIVLASRRGIRAAGAEELRAELVAAGARVRVVECDIADREQVRRLLSQSAPVTAVVHTAGVLDDAMITDLDPRRIDAVFRPKVDAVTHLDELTRDLDLAVFAVFSSVSGVLGGAGQGNYAAANAFLDAVMIRRRAAGRPALSLGWGPWGEIGGMAGTVRAADLNRMARFGLHQIEPVQGMRLFDAALRAGRAAVVPVALDAPALRVRARAGELPAMLQGLAGPVRRTAEPAAAVLARLSSLDLARQLAALADLVRAEAAVVLGSPAGGYASATRAFRDEGFDSLMSTELRNRLTSLTGVKLPATVVFDHPTPEALAKHLQLDLFGRAQPEQPRDDLSDLVAEMDVDELVRRALTEGA